MKTVTIIFSMFRLVTVEILSYGVRYPLIIAKMRAVQGVWVSNLAKIKTSTTLISVARWKFLKSARLNSVKNRHFLPLYYPFVISKMGGWNQFLCRQARKFFNFGVENPQNWHKNASKSPKIAIFSGVANSSQKIATLRWLPATPFVPPASFKSSQFGGIPPRLATLTLMTSSTLKKPRASFLKPTFI